MADTGSGRPDGWWASGAVYEPYVGRWSRLVAREFLAWLNAPPNARWLDVGAGTGALSSAILAQAEPRSVTGIDASPGFVAYTQANVPDGRARFEVGDAAHLPWADGEFDAAVSGLVLNFVTDPDAAAAEMARVVRPGGIIGAYVWDYSGGMEMMRHFWDAALTLEPEANVPDQGPANPICRPDPLRRLLEGAGLTGVEVRPIDVPTVFQDFDDYWTPFLGGQAAAPKYAMSLDEDRRTALRQHLRSQLPIRDDGTIHLTARTWAVRGYR